MPPSKSSSPSISSSPHNLPSAAAGSSSKQTKYDPYLPTMIVFDLDDCLWTPEMHELPGYPDIPITGYLDPTSENTDDVGVIGMQVPRYKTTVRLYDGARLALRELATNDEYKDVIIGVASTSLEPSYSHCCLEGLEIVPGVTLRDMVSHDQIGRDGELTSRKTSHFRLLHRESGVPYDEMLFFDDCNWGDHCGDVTNMFGVVSVRTPNGLQLKEFHRGLEKYRKEVEERMKKKGGEL